jgi:hypothetical protein
MFCLNGSTDELRFLSYQDTRLYSPSLRFTPELEEEYLNGLFANPQDEPSAPPPEVISLEGDSESEEDEDDDVVILSPSTTSSPVAGPSRLRDLELDSRKIKQGGFASDSDTEMEEAEPSVEPLFDVSRDRKGKGVSSQQLSFFSFTPYPRFLSTASPICIIHSNHFPSAQTSRTDCFPSIFKI